MLATIASALGGKLFDSFFANARGMLKDYQDRKISEAEFATRLKEAFLKSFTQVEDAHADLTAKTFDSFQQTMRTSPEVRTAWCWVLYTQLFILCWHQFVIPLLVMLVRLSSPQWNYPSSGNTVEWAYALIGFMLGSGAMLMRVGPGAGGVVDNLKRMFGR